MARAKLYDGNGVYCLYSNNFIKSCFLIHLLCRYFLQNLNVILKIYRKETEKNLDQSVSIRTSIKKYEDFFPFLFALVDRKLGAQT